MNNNFEYLIAKEKAVKFIGIAKKSSVEVRNKLIRSGVEEEIANEVIEELAQKGYLNDHDYAKSYITQELKLMNKSKFEIKCFLLKKGIREDLFADELERVDSEYESAIVEKLCNTKLKGMEINKVKAYLYRRGFNVNIY